MSRKSWGPRYLKYCLEVSGGGGDLQKADRNVLDEEVLLVPQVLSPGRRTQPEEDRSGEL